MANYLLQADPAGTCCDCPPRASPCDDCAGVCVCPPCDSYPFSSVTVQLTGVYSGPCTGSPVTAAVDPFTVNICDITWDTGPFEDDPCDCEEHRDMCFDATGGACNKTVSPLFVAASQTFLCCQGGVWKIWLNGTNSFSAGGGCVDDGLFSTGLFLATLGSTPDGVVVADQPNNVRLTWTVSSS